MGCENPVTQQVQRNVPQGAPLDIRVNERLIPSIQASVTLNNITDTEIAAENLQRRVLIVNNSSAVAVYLTFDGSPADATRFHLSPGQALTIDPTIFGDMLTAAVRGFQNSGAPITIYVLELERTT